MLGAMPFLQLTTDDIHILAHICTMKLSASDVFKQCPWGGSFHVSRKGGTGGGGWVHPIAKDANSMTASELGCRKALVDNIL